MLTVTWAGPGRTAANRYTGTFFETVGVERIMLGR